MSKLIQCDICGMTIPLSEYNQKEKMVLKAEFTAYIATGAGAILAGSPLHEFDVCNDCLKKWIFEDETKEDENGA